MSDSGSPKQGQNTPKEVLDALLKTSGRLRKGIKADNSSLFACFSDLIYFGGENFQRVKQTFLDHIDANKLQYSEVIAHDLGKDIDTYVSDIQKSSATTCTFELKILSELYSVNVELFTFDGSQLKRIQISNRYINSLSLLEYQPGMYDSLISNQAIRANVVNNVGTSSSGGVDTVKATEERSSPINNAENDNAIFTEQEDFVITRADSGLGARRKDFGDLTVSVSANKAATNGPGTAGTGHSTSTAGRGHPTGGSSSRTTASSNRTPNRTAGGGGGFNFRKEQSDNNQNANFDFTKVARTGGALSAPVIRKTSYFDFRRAENVLRDENSAFNARSATSRKIGETGPGRNSFFGSRNAGTARKRVPDMFQFPMDDVTEEADEDGARSGSNAGTPIPPGFSASTRDSSRVGQTPGKRKTIPEKSNMFKTKNFVPETRSIQRYSGTLKFFDEKKNFGFIVMDSDPDHDVFVHYDDISKSDISKSILKMKNKVLRLSFVLMEYHGKSKQSKKAIDIALEEIRDKTEGDIGLMA